jgi:predicted lipid-binding transport protein (Tim44 family)
MSKHIRLLPAALAAVLATTVVAPVASANVSSQRARVQTTQARFGGRVFRPAPAYRYRRWPRAPYRRAYRPRPFHGFFGGLLRVLGLAYLAHLLFGWGAGGSPLGLFMLAAVILWLATRRRRRPAYW